MITLTVSEILRLHQKLLDATGGLSGTRNLGLLESAVYSANQVIFQPSPALWALSGTMQDTVSRYAQCRVYHNDEIKRWRRLTLSRCVPLIVYSGAQREQNAPLVIPAGIKNPHPRTRLTYSRSSDQQFLIYAWEERIIFSPWPQLWGNLPFPGAGSQLIHRGYHIVRVRFPRKRP